MNTAPKPWPLALLLALTATTSWAAPLRERSVHPLIDLGSGYLLGGSANGRWLKPAQIARLMEGGEGYPKRRKAPAFRHGDISRVERSSTCCRA